MTGTSPHEERRGDQKPPEFLMIGPGVSEPTEKTQRIQFSLPSLAEAIWKQKVSIGTVWLTVSLFAIIIVHLLPPVYQAEALVLLESQRIPHDFVNPTTVRADLWERLSSLDQRVLSHTQLLALIETFGLYREEAKKLTQEELVERMREDIEIKLEQGLGAVNSNRPPAFRVVYQGTEPEQVAQVANRLAYLFIEQDLRERSVEAVGTAEFLESQLETARQQLETQEGRLSRYKTEHNGELPEQEAALLGTLSRLEAQLQANQEAVRQAQQDKFFTKNALDVAISSAEDLRAITQRPDNTLAAANSEAAAVLEDPTTRALREQRRDLIELRRRYTESHPEVVKAKEALRKLEVNVGGYGAPVDAQTEPAANNSKNPEPDTVSKKNPALASLLEPELRRREDQVRQYQTQLKSLDNRIQMLESSQDRLTKSISSAEFQIQKLPLREQEMAALIRDYEITKGNYQSLLQKRMNADLAMEMEKRQKSEKFVLLDSARVPTEPIKPKLLVLSLLGSLLGLAFGTAFGLGRELKNDVFLGEWELPKELNVMGRVPHFAVGNVERTELSFRRVVVASSVLMLLIILGIGAVKLHGSWPVF
jgi:polysaccharide chain length determinant protein (PEP-CTERM system associated)